MKLKTSVTLSSELLEQIDKVHSNRSSFFEQAALEFLQKTEKSARDIKDAGILSRRADQLNREAADVLDYQEFKS
jgi:metal-responsive CopG/Arc/MetJ family transcriptional regulator